MSYHMGPESGGAFVNIPEAGYGFVNVPESGGAFVTFPESAGAFINLPESGAGFVNIPETGATPIIELGAMNPCTAVDGQGVQTIGCALPLALKAMCFDYTGTENERKIIVAQIKVDIANKMYKGERRDDYLACFEELTPEKAPGLYTASELAALSADQKDDALSAQEVNTIVQDWFTKLADTTKDFYQIVEGKGDGEETVDEATLEEFDLGMPRRVSPVVIAGGIAVAIGALAFFLRRPTKGK